MSGRRPPDGPPRHAGGVGDQRGIIAALTLLAIVQVAVIVHVASLLIVPRVAPDDAFARLAAGAPEAVVTPLPRAGAPGTGQAARDPALASALCRYDLDHGPLRVSAALGDEAFLALTLHSRSGVAFYGLNDRAGNDGRLDLVVMTRAQFEEAKARDTSDAPVRDVRVVAPQREGFALVDALPRPAGAAGPRRAPASMRCSVERPL